MLHRAFVIASCLLAISSCAVPVSEPLSVRVRWDLTGTSALPEDVTDVEIVSCLRPLQGEESCGTSTCSVNALTLNTPMDVPTCRPREGTEMYGTNPVLVRTGLPTYEELRFELRGKGAAGEVLYVGQAGPFMLADGERRFVDLQMYPLGRSALVPSAELSRFLHTATWLPDGRVLVAGGFSRALRADCDEELALPEAARCFELEASAEALAFEPSTGRLTPIRSAMLAARGGHTATALPDGRVLLAGGAPRAVLALVPQGAGQALMLFPRLADGSDGAFDHLELFDAFLDEAEDPERDGDPARGRFLGALGQRTPAPLNAPRFLHAAAPVPTAPNRVLLVGGMGGADSAATYEVFDANRAGGFGVYAGRNLLDTPRLAPSAVAVRSRVWIFGGAAASSNAQLAEIWTPSPTDPNGEIRAASEAGQFPSSASGGEEERPEYALLRPLVGPVAEGARALVIGWLGPRCEVGSTSPRFDDGAVPVELCGAPTGAATRSFTVNDTTGVAAPTPTRSRALGALAELRCFRPSRTERHLMATGGSSSASWIPQGNVDLFDGGLDSAGAARRTDAPISLVAPRFLHTSTGVPGFGVVTLGGITFGATFEQVVFQRAAEVVFVARPDDGC